VSRKSEIKVGVTVLASLAILVWALAWLKDLTLHRSVRTWTISFPQTGGLSSSDEVQVNGIRKGQVKSMSLSGDHVVVELELSKEITLTHDSRVSIRNIGLMGERVIAVDLRATGAPYALRDTIQGNYEPGLGEVMGQLGGTIEAVTDLSEQLRDVAVMLNRDDRLAKTIHSFNQTSEELRLTVSENRASLRTTLDNFASASRTAKALTTDREAQLRKALDDFSSAAEKMDHLSGRLDSLRAVIQGLSSKVARGEGTLGKLVTDDKLYADLNSSISSLKALIEDVKANPKKYFKFSVF
jgi:phospholipid/cholesterol/gamma-HCH transport system substrate-binding protein